MIEWIRLENFQSHEDTTVEFVAGTNALVGLSRSGKTGILRGLKKIMTNKPPGNAFQSWSGGKTKITVGLEEGTEILWGIDATGAYYKMWTPLEDGTIKEDLFRAFGQGIPDEIVAAFNMTDVNSQGQMDRVFMLSLQPGEVATELNKAVRLDVIGKATSAIRKQKLAADADYTRGQAAVVTLTKSLEGFDFLNGIEEAIKMLESAVSEKEGKEANVAAIKTASGQNSALLATITKADKVLKVGPRVKALDIMINNLEVKSKKLAAMNVLIYNATNERDIVVASTATAGKERRFNAVSKQATLRDKKESQKMTVGSLIAWRGKVTRQGKVAGDNLLAKETEFAALMPDVCPLCGEGQL